MLDCDVVVDHACDCGVAAALTSGGNLGRTWNPCCANQCRGDPSARKQSLSSFSNRPWRDGRGVAVDSQPGSPYGDRLTNRVQGRSPNNHHASSCSAVRLDAARGPITRCFPQRVVGRFRPFRRQCQKTLVFYKRLRGRSDPQQRSGSGAACGGGRPGVSRDEDGRDPAARPCSVMPEAIFFARFDPVVISLGVSEFDPDNRSIGRANRIENTATGVPV